MSRQPPVQSRLARARRRGAALLLAAGLLAAPLAGCASEPPPELGTEAAKELQSRVLAVTEAAAAADTPAALQMLDELVTRLDGAAARGEVSFQRHQSIGAAVAAVRTELNDRQAAADAAAKAAADAAAQAAAADAAAKAAAAEAAAKAAADEAAAKAPAPPPAPAPGKQDKQDKSKGKDKDD